MTHPQSLSLTSWIHVFWHWILWLQLEYLWDTPVAALYCGAPRPHRCNLLPAFPTPPVRLRRFRRGIPVPSRGSRLRTWTTLYQRQGPGPTMDDPMLLQHLKLNGKKCWKHFCMVGKTSDNRRFCVECGEIRRYIYIYFLHVYYICKHIFTLFFNAPHINIILFQCENTCNIYFSINLVIQEQW